MIEIFGLPLGDIAVLGIEGVKKIFILIEKIIVKIYETNIFIPNFYTVEIKKFNPLEYDIGLFALKK